MIVLERVTRVAPFGVRLWDEATDTPAGEGVVVRHPRMGGGPPVVAVRTPSGVHSLRGLPGLVASEQGAGDDEFWASPPAHGSYRIEVVDPEGRFLPMSFDAALPARNLFRLSCDSSGSPPSPPSPLAPVVPLFSAPTRPVPAGTAVVRAQLELTTGGPASWALLHLVLPDGGVRRGAADGAGRATVLFAWPEPPDPPLPTPGSPPGPVPGTPTRWTWTLQLRAFFGSGGTDRTPVADADGIPDFCALLGQRPVTPLFDTRTPMTTVDLHYGRELIVQTKDHSTLLVPA